jgi:glycerol-3-phosphate dehydrogenase
LVKPQDDDGESTKALSREHTVIVSRSGLVTVTGGKWTTYRAMAEDVLAKCADKGLLQQRPAGQTEDLPLVGADAPTGFVPVSVSKTEGPHSYGSEHVVLGSLPGDGVWLAAGLSEAMVRFAARYEYAVTVEDMLARRSRMLFLDARLAAELAPRVAEILEEETGLNPQKFAFAQLAAQYLQIP